MLGYITLRRFFLIKEWNVLSAIHGLPENILRLFDTLFSLYVYVIEIVDDLLSFHMWVGIC